MMEEPGGQPRADEKTATQQTEPPKRTIQFFLARNADDDPTLSGFLQPGTASEETAERFARLKEAGHDDGLTLHMLFRQPGGFSLVMVWIKPNFRLPLHSHDTDCMYYVATGSIVMGNRTLRAGDGFFVPRDCLYAYAGGPDGAEVLEVRFGADYVDSYVPPISTKRIESELKILKANAQSWKEMRVGPTLAANDAAD